MRQGKLFAEYADNNLTPRGVLRSYNTRSCKCNFTKHVIELTQSYSLAVAITRIQCAVTLHVIARNRDSGSVDLMGNVLTPPPPRLLKYEPSSRLLCFHYKHKIFSIIFLSQLQFEMYRTAIYMHTPVSATTITAAQSIATKWVVFYRACIGTADI